MLLIGDAAGLAYPQSGEGIRPAVESALLAARVIDECNHDYSAARLQRYTDLIEQRFQMEGAESLELLTRAMSEMAENPELGQALIELAPTLSDQDKEDIALMSLKVIAADGRRDVREMEKFNEAVEALGISPDAVHRAFDRYFSETMPGS